MLEGNFRADSGYDLTRRLLERRRRPTAIVCGNDLMALGAYFAIGEHGLRVPDDVSVVGYDDLEDIASHIQPALSTIRLPYYEMGRLAAEHLLGGTAGSLPRRTLIPARPCPERRSGLRRGRGDLLGARRAGELARGEDGEHDGDADRPGEGDPRVVARVLAVVERPAGVGERS